MVHKVLCNDLIGTYMKLWVENFDEELEKRLDGTNFVDDVDADFYIEYVYEADKAAHRDGSNTPDNTSKIARRH